MKQTFVVVGAGLAGAKAVQTLREAGFDGRILLIGAEAERPYERPPLSKGYLAGTAPRESVFVHEAAWYAVNDIELLLGSRVTHMDLPAKELRLDRTERLGFDKLLLTTGSSARRVNTPGIDLAGVHYLRQLEDSDALIGALSQGGRHVVFLGGGWIGLEVAAAARSYGNEVTVVEQQRTPLNAALGDELGGMFADLHREHGVRLLLQDSVESIHGVGGRVSAVATSGRVLPADVVVVGLGARPNIELALNARLDVNDGVLVDESLRSSHPDVYAAGDVANAYHPGLGRRLRVEHWANALHGGPAAARSMLGEPVSYDRVPYFFTDQYDLGMEFSGALGPERYDRIVYRGDRDARRFIAFWTLQGRVVAGMNVNVWDVNDEIQTLIRSRRAVDLDQLADPDVPLHHFSAAQVGS
jgi:3-phenylpropionate/trans-cinnamate dioxygenase ferredoxin reductase subunit